MITLKNCLIAVLVLLLLICSVGCSSGQTEQHPTPVPEKSETLVPEITTEAEIPSQELPAPIPEEPEQEFTEEASTESPDPVTPQESETTAPSEDPLPSETEHKPETIPDSEAEPAPESVPETTEPPVESPSSKLPVLMYHHVVPDGSSCNDMTVTVSKLAKDFQWLNDHGYESILPEQLLSGEPLPEKPVLITFDDGYRSNYELAYPLFQQYRTKAVISIMVYMQDHNISQSVSWDMCREMTGSGLVEIGSHTYRLHNLDERNGNFTPGGINGIQRDPNESDEEFQTRVLADIQLSHDLIEANLGCDPIFFAYPFGIREADAEALINELFPVTVVTAKGTADLSGGTKNLTRWTVTMNTDLASILP